MKLNTKKTRKYHGGAAVLVGRGAEAHYANALRDALRDGRSGIVFLSQDKVPIEFIHFLLAWDVKGGVYLDIGSTHNQDTIYITLDKDRRMQENHIHFFDFRRGFFSYKHKKGNKVTGVPIPTTDADIRAFINIMYPILVVNDPKRLRNRDRSRSQGRANRSSQNLPPPPPRPHSRSRSRSQGRGNGPSQHQPAGERANGGLPHYGER